MAGTLCPIDMIRFVIRLLLPLIAFLVVRALLKSVFVSIRSYSNTPSRAPQPPPVPAGGELKKDPVCGTYVSATTSLTRIVNGRVLYFCSSQCRDKYRVA